MFHLFSRQLSSRHFPADHKGLTHHEPWHPAPALPSYEAEPTTPSIGTLNHTEKINHDGQYLHNTLIEFRFRIDYLMRCPVLPDCRL